MIKALISVANKLDQLGHYDEADAVDQFIQEIINGLEDHSIPDGQKEKQNEEAAVRSNGLEGNSVIDNSKFQGLFDAYMIGGGGSYYGALEGAFGPQH